MHFTELQKPCPGWGRLGEVFPSHPVPQVLCCFSCRQGKVSVPVSSAPFPTACLVLWGQNAPCGGFAAKGVGSGSARAGAVLETSSVCCSCSA